MTVQRLVVPRVMGEAEALAMKNTRVPDLPPTDLPEGPLLIVDEATDKPVALLARADPDDVEAMRAAILAFRKRFGGVLRQGGMRSKSGSFGYSAAAHMMKRLSPAAAMWSWQDPDSHGVVAGYAGTLARVFADLGPEAPLAVNAEARNRINPDWRMADTCWTSGIVNDTAPLYYHHDANNLADTWSAMLTVRAGTRGGHLHLADYGLTLPCRNGDLLFFPGMDVMHGVTPITESLHGGHRFTAVYYCVRRFVGAVGAAEAKHTAQVRRSTLEDELLARQRDRGLIR